MTHSKRLTVEVSAVGEEHARSLITVMSQQVARATPRVSLKKRRRHSLCATASLQSYHITSVTLIQT